MNCVRGAFCLFVTVVGCGAIGGGALTAQPSWVVKAERADQQRQSDVATIAHAISLFEMRNKDLPYDLTKLAESLTDGTIRLASATKRATRLTITSVSIHGATSSARISRWKACQGRLRPSTPRARTRPTLAAPGGSLLFPVHGESPTPLPVAPAVEATD